MLIIILYFYNNKFCNSRNNDSFENFVKKIVNFEIYTEYGI